MSAPKNEVIIVGWSSWDASLNSEFRPSVAFHDSKSGNFIDCSGWPTYRIKHHDFWLPLPKIKQSD